jgi:hypothetical protein
VISGVHVLVRDEHGVRVAVSGTRTSTAKTLYSGQLVLTSAEEPTSRLVRTSEKWNADEDVARFDAVGDLRNGLDAPHPAVHGDRVASLDPQTSAVVGVNLQRLVRTSSRFAVRRVIVPALWCCSRLPLIRINGAAISPTTCSIVTRTRSPLGHAPSSPQLYS